MFERLDVDVDDETLRELATMYRKKEGSSYIQRA